MSTLYDLTGEYLELLGMMEDEDVDEETLRDTMEAVGGEIEDKADAIAKVLTEIKCVAEAIDQEEKRLNARKKMLLGNADRLKGYLERSMIVTGKTKFKTPFFSFGIRKNPPSVVIDNEEEVPADFWVVKDPTIDKTALKRYL